MAQVNQNLSDVEVNAEILAPGWYLAEVIDSEIKEGPKGAYIKWTWRIVGKTNRVYDIQSFGNEYGLKNLKTMLTCCGHRNPSYLGDTEELHGRRCGIKLKIERSEDYDDKNVIQAFRILKEEGAQTMTAPGAALFQGLPIPSAHVDPAAIPGDPGIGGKMPFVSSKAPVDIPPEIAAAALATPVNGGAPVKMPWEK